MSTKQRIARALATLPEDLSIEDALDRLYKAFTLKYELDADWLGPVPPLPTDPSVLPEISAGIEEGLAQARAGLGEDWETVHERLRSQLNLPSLQ